MSGAVRVQTVRYGGDDRALLRLMASIVAAGRVARDRHAITSLTVALGDCGGPGGPDARLDNDVATRINEVLTAGDIAFEYVAFGENLGHGGGQNRLAELAGSTADHSPEGEHLMVLNPDTYLVPSALAELFAALNEDHSVGIAEARQIPLEHPKPFDLVTGETPWASGFAIALPRELFSSLGGFERAFFLHGDDVDLSWRVRMRGLTIRHVVSAAIFHDKRPAAHGYPHGTETEEYHGTLARLLLAHRAERPDVIATALERAEAGNARHQGGAAEFKRRQGAGDLPRTYRESLGVSIDVVANVVALDGVEYAAHRF